MAGNNHKASDSSSENLSDSASDETINSGGADAADSSNAGDSNKSKEDEHKSLLDVVKSAVEEDADDTAEDETEGKDDKANKDDAKKTKDGASSASGGKTDDDADDEFSEEDLAKEKPPTQKRIKALIGKLETANTQVEEYRPKAERFDRMDAYMVNNGITPEEAAEAFTIMALVKTDPAKALERLRIHTDSVARAVGEILPDDLQKKVDDGTMDEETAKEISKTRASAKHQQTLREATEKRTEDDRARQESAKQTNSLVTTLNNWQIEKQKSDPDYAIKHDMLQVNIRALLVEKGKPSTPEQVMALADEAYKRVNAQIGRVAPKVQIKEKKAIASRSTSGPRAESKPNSVLDVVRKTVKQ